MNFFKIVFFAIIVLLMFNLNAQTVAEAQAAFDEGEYTKAYEMSGFKTKADPDYKAFRKIAKASEQRIAQIAELNKQRAAFQKSLDVEALLKFVIYEDDFGGQTIYKRKLTGAGSWVSATNVEQVGVPNSYVNLWVNYAENGTATITFNIPHSTKKGNHVNQTMSEQNWLDAENVKIKDMDGNLYEFDVVTMRHTKLSNALSTKYIEMISNAQFTVPTDHALVQSMLDNPEGSFKVRFQTASKHVEILAMKYKSGAQDAINLLRVLDRQYKESSKTSTQP